MLMTEEETKTEEVKDSILNSIKKLLGIESSYTNFDTDIIMHINSIFVILNQIGFGPEDGFTISDSEAKWSEYCEKEMIETVKTYIYLRVRLLFDPPSNGAVMEAIKQTIQELEWRINVGSDNT
jgi:hypothetical protein